jgi:propionyl-CoA synthetase
MTPAQNQYQDAWDRWRAAPEQFWLAAAASITWSRAPQRAFDESPASLVHWFPDARVNACYNAVDRHCDAGFGAQPALIHVSAMTGQEQSFSYAQLRVEVARLAGVLRALGVTPGDRVVIYMPMVPEALLAMLACARLGAIHSVVFGGFAARELAVRIDDAQPKVILSASCGLEPGRVLDYKALLDKALDMAKHAPSSCVILQRPQLSVALKAGRDHDWRELLANAAPAECVPMESTAPLYIL